MTALTSTSVADAAEVHLRRLLFSGSFQPGQVLKDTVLAKDLGIARPTVRTAVLRLVSEGLLEREPGHSARVRAFTEEDVTDIYRARRLFELEAVRVISAESRDTGEIRNALAAFQSLGDTWEAGFGADAQFHTAVVAAAGSPRLTRMFESVASEMRLMTGLHRLRYGTLTEICSEHAALLDTLQSGDTPMALQLWEEHIDDTERYVRASISNSA